MKLITETVEDVEIITEKSVNGKDYFLRGIFMQSEQKNRNGRIYPKEILETAVNTYNETYVKTGRAVGELNHPEGPQINLDKVSHRITELNWSGNDVIGEALVLETPMGQIVKGLLSGGCKLGVSSRGMGSTTNKGGVSTINSDFVLSTVDIVQDPSAPSAFVNGIMEGVEYFYEGNELITIATNRAKNNIDKLRLSQITEKQTEIFADFLKEIGI
jgi:hypothetical protein